MSSESVKCDKVFIGKDNKKNLELNKPIPLFDYSEPLYNSFRILIKNSGSIGELSALKVLIELHKDDFIEMHYDRLRIRLQRQAYILL